MDIPPLPPAIPPTRKGMSTGGKVILVVVGLLILGAMVNAFGEGDSDQFDPGVVDSNLDAPSAPAVDFEVLSCSTEFGFGTARVEFTVGRPYSYVAFVGDYIDADGVAIGQGLGNATDVVPGQTYRLEVLYSLTGKPKGGTCHVRVGNVLE